VQRSLKAQLLTTAISLQTRWLLFEQSGSSIPVPFLVVLVFWLSLIFASFGLFWLKANRRATDRDGQAWRKGSSEIRISPSNGVSSSRIRKITPETDSALRSRATTTVALGGAEATRKVEGPAPTHLRGFGGETRDDEQQDDSAGQYRGDAGPFQMVDPVGPKSEHYERHSAKRRNP
jgi:hypothetical protein